MGCGICMAFSFLYISLNGSAVILYIVTEEAVDFTLWYNLFKNVCEVFEDNKVF